MSLFANVNVVSVYVTDWERAKAFYRQTLGWPVAYSDDQVGWEEYGLENATHIAINRWDGPEAVPPRQGGATPVFSVDDAYKVAEALRAQGVKCDEVIAIPGVVTYGTFYDPEGNRFQFASNAM
jgi:predicted enzyme related to lactoylglutathione lyase